MISFFTDPVLRAPTLGAMLMCLTASLVGVVAYVRRRSLVGETLSHAAYPGIVLGASIALFDGVMLAGAFVSALLALWLSNLLQKRLRLSSDASLCAILVAFLGIGVLLASHLQFARPILYTQVQVFLYGQAATLLDSHVIMYALLASVTILFIALYFHQIKAINFDRAFSDSIGLRSNAIDVLTLALLALAVVVGIRSVGVVLMSGMLIAPAVAARKLTHRLSIMLILSAIIGMSCGFAGTYFSVTLAAFRLPTGPIIVLLAASIALLAMLFAPSQGLLTRGLRIMRFRRLCQVENVLKVFWKGGDLPMREVGKRLGMKATHVRLIIARLVREGWCKEVAGSYALTPDGNKRATRIVRLHRLWEVYLTSELGIGKDRVHPSAEEMEHIITPELELRLVLLLKNPKKDPHLQPIPRTE